MHLKYPQAIVNDTIKIWKTKNMNVFPWVCILMVAVCKRTRFDQSILPWISVRTYCLLFLFRWDYRDQQKSKLSTNSCGPKVQLVNCISSFHLLDCKISFVNFCWNLIPGNLSFQHLSTDLTKSRTLEYSTSYQLFLCINLLPLYPAYIEFSPHSFIENSQAKLTLSSLQCENSNMNPRAFSAAI